MGGCCSVVLSNALHVLGIDKVGNNTGWGSKLGTAQQKPHLEFSVSKDSEEIEIKYQ